MATIDEIDFKVILHDEDFDKRVKASIKKAEQLNTQLSKLLEIERKVGNVQITGAKELAQQERLLKITAQRKNEEAKTAITMEKLAISTMKREQTERSIAEDLARQALGIKDVADRSEEAARAHGRSRSNVENTNKALSQSSNILRQLSTMAGAYFSVQGARRFLGSLIDITGQFEVQKMALTSMLQSGDMADKIFNQYRQLALNSPYTFQDFTKFGKQLTAFNIPAQELVGTTKMLADVAAGLGVDMGRIILAYGQIKSAGVLKGTELRQLTEAGVPILDSLAKQIEETTGKTVKLSEVFSMISKKQIPFEMVEQAFKDMTAEGGKFYNMQEVLVETLQGKIGKLRDTWQQMLYDMGSGGDMNRILKGSVDAVTFLVRNFETLGKVIAPVVAGFGVYGAALAVVAIRQKALQLANFVSMLYKAATGSKAAAAAITLMGNAGKIAAASFGLISAIAVGIIAIANAASRSKRALDDFKKSLDDVHKASVENNSYDKEISQLTTLRKILNDTSNSYQARQNALEEIKGIVPSYHASLTEEGRLINNNRKELDKYIAALKREARMKGAKDELAELYKLRREQERVITNATDLADDFNEALRKASDSSIAVFYSNKIGEQEKIIKNAKAKLTEIDKRILPIEEELKTALGETGDELDTTISTRIPDLLAGIRKIKSEIAGLREKASTIGLSENEVKKLESLTAELEVEKKKYELLVGESQTAADTGREKETKREIDLLKTEIALLQKYKDTYDKLSATDLIGSENAGKLVRGLYGVEDMDFVKQITDKLDELERRFSGESGVTEYIAGIKAALGKDSASKLLDLVSAFERLKDARDKLDAKEFNAEGTGAFFDIVKALRDGITKMNEADLKRLETQKLLSAVQRGDEESLAALREILGEEVWRKYVTEGEKAIDDLYDKERSMIKKSMVDRIAALAKTYAKEAVDDFDTADLWHKSRSQLSELYSQVSGARNVSWNKILQNEELQKAIENGTITLDEAKASYDKFFDYLLKRIKDEGAKKLVKGIQGIFKAFGGTGEIFKNIGEKTGNSGIKTLGEMISLSDELASALVENEKIFDTLFGGKRVAKTAEDMGNLADTTDWIMFALKVALILFQRIAEAIGESYEAQRALNQAEADYLESLREIARLKNEGYFGDDAIGALATNWDNATQAAEKYRKTLEKDTGQTRLSGWFGFKVIYGNLSDLARGFPGILDANGNLNMEYIKAYSDVFKKGSGILGSWKISDGLALLLDELITNYDAMTKETEAFADSVKSIFGSLSDTIADGMVDAFLETGDALGKLDESFEDFGENIAKIMLRSILSAKMMERFEGRINELSESYLKELGAGSRESADMKFAEMLAGLAGEMKNFAEGYGEFANSFLSSMQQSGLLGSGEKSDTLANGIKGITEDTANLLASYLNAVRADVSGLRMLAETGWRDVKSILAACGMMNSLPTLNDHLAQVAASSADIARTNQQMLAEIQSVMTSSSGRRAIAVDIQ